MHSQETDEKEFNMHVLKANIETNLYIIDTQ